MGNLTSYRLSDFILFSETAYYRQFEIYNQSIWPLQIVALLFSLFILYALWKKPAWAGQVMSGLLIVSWSWVAWAFLYQRFYQIHVVADWYALCFFLQAGLFTWYGVRKDRFNMITSNQSRLYIGYLLLLVSIIFYPFIAMLSDRDWMQFEMFAVAPDPTVLATLAILIIFKAPKVLYVIPISWVIVSGATLSVM